MVIKYHNLKITVCDTLSDVHFGRYVWWIMIQMVEPWHSVHSELFRADAYLRTGNSEFPPQFLSQQNGMMKNDHFQVNQHLNNIFFFIITDTLRTWISGWYYTDLPVCVWIFLNCVYSLEHWKLTAGILHQSILCCRDKVFALLFRFLLVISNS